MIYEVSQMANDVFFFPKVKYKIKDSKKFYILSFFHCTCSDTLIPTVKELSPNPRMIYNNSTKSLTSQCLVGVG